MGTIIIVLAVIGLLLLFVYLKFPPPYANPKLVSVYNKMVLAVGGLLCLVWILTAYTNWAGTPDEKWWIPLAIAGSIGIEIVFLGICFLLRNFWIFNPPRRPGGF